MMAPGLKPVGWVAAVASAALCCYMLSLNVASERAELARIERQILATKQDIRALQTELGTRGRLAQLEQWNADVLALSAPASNQFLDSEMKLARFDPRVPTLDERAKVRMASAPAAPAVSAAPVKIEAPVLRAAAPAQPALAPESTLQVQPLLRKASLQVPAAQVPAAKPVTTERSTAAAQPAKPASETAKNRIDDTLRKEIRAANGEADFAQR